MKIVIIHGQQHKGVTYTMTQSVINHIKQEKEIKEFFLPKDGPDFCHGCINCFLKGEEFCPSADKVQPIMKAIEWADLIVLDSPNYCMEMSGAMKNLLDHFAYRWVTHRPYGGMFKKAGLTLSSSAGAPPRQIVKSMAKQLKWMGVPKRFRFPMVSSAMGVNDLKDAKKIEIDKKAGKLARKIERYLKNPRPSIMTKILFYMFKGMQSGEKSAWNPTDQKWWKDQGWLNGKKPWK